ncbi:hypothetical protein, partial [Enterobacter asburiae]|uniref:hypothetical protein n=1 Tax=Enterobacter asburiae TaxID=61645 RepID=UPI0021D1F20A
DGRTMDMYHKWNTAPTAQVRRDMLAVANEEALKMDDALTNSQVEIATVIPDTRPMSEASKKFYSFSSNK